MAKKKAVSKGKSKATKAPKETKVARSGGGSFRDRLRKQLSESSRNSTGRSDFWRPEVGTSTVRLVAFKTVGEKTTMVADLDKEKEGELFVEDTRHWNIDGNQGSNCACLGESCPMCALKDEVTTKGWDKIKPRKSFLVNAVLREGNDEGKDKLVIAQFPVTAMKQFLMYVVGDEEGTLEPIPHVLDPNKGRDFQVKRSGKGLETKYLVVPKQAVGKLGLDVEPHDLFKKKKRELPEEEVKALAEAFQELQGER